MKTENGLKFYYAALMASVVFWGGTFIASKLAYEVYSPIQLSGLRPIVAAILFWIVRKVKRDNETIEPADRKRLVGSAFLGITLCMMFQNIGISLTTSSNAALIVASFPAITILLELFIYHIRPTLNKVVGIAISVSGIIILSQISLEGNPTALWGNLLMVAAGIVWALYSFATGALINKYSTMTVTYYQMLAGATLCIPFILLEGNEWGAPALIPTAAVLYLGICGSMLAFLFYNKGLRRLSASVAVSFLNLVPVVALILSVVVLNEKISAMQLFGGAVVILGVMISSKK
ncbi:MAG: EamA family transporter [Clostridia bacterium]|nr:EamA family transporter [Clostridia bacterium]